MTTSPERLASQRIADARAGRTPVDHNGRPVGPPSSFEYDDRGHLLRVVAGLDADTSTDPVAPRRNDLVDAELARNRARKAAFLETEQARRAALAARWDPDTGTTRT